MKKITKENLIKHQEILNKISKSKIKLDNINKCIDQKKDKLKTIEKNLKFIHKTFKNKVLIDFYELEKLRAESEWLNKLNYAAKEYI